MVASPECLVAGHRGFKGKYPENTIGGFKKCFDTGATIFETDVWSTKDGILVISHDPNTKRVFVDEEGNETNYFILDTLYDDIKNLRTIGSNEKLITFKQLLTWFKEEVKKYGPSSQHKIMLDIKKLNPVKILNQIVEDLLSVENDLAWWFPHLQFGLWDIKFLKYLNQDEFFQKQFSLTEPNQGYEHFDIVHISFSWRDSLFYLAYNDYLNETDSGRFKFKLTAVSLIYISTWSSDFLSEFVPVAKAHDIKLFSWTINTRPQLEYFCALGHNARFREYGVITDFPDEMVGYINEVEAEREEETGKDLESRALLPAGSPVYLPFRFKLSNWFFNLVVRLVNFKQAAVPQPVPFSTPVDPEEKTAIPISTFGMKVFATCQYYGIF